MLQGYAPSSMSSLYPAESEPSDESLMLLKNGQFWASIRSSCHFTEDQTDNDCYLLLRSKFSELSEAKQLDVAVASLFVFVQNNFTGPLPCKEFIKFTQSVDEELVEEHQTISNTIYPLIRCFRLLVLASEHFTKAESSLLSLVYSLRCQYILHQLYDEVCVERFAAIEALVKEIELCPEFEALPVSDKSKIHTEISFVYLAFDQLTKARHHNDLSQSLIGFEAKLTGVMGKKTKFANKWIPMLRVDYTINADITSSVTNTAEEDVPSPLDLNDDTLLDKIDFQDSGSSSVNNVTAPFLLFAACIKLEDNYLDEMLREEVIAFLEAIIEGTQFSYCVQTHAYFLRSKLERSSYRRMARCMQQLEDVVLNFSSNQDSSRTGFIFLSGLPPMWKQEKLLAEIYTKVGSHKSAMDIYERLELWEDNIVALQQIGRYEAAEKLTRKLLEEKETPKLYCILGDVTTDISHYHKAWELSDQHYGRAMRSLGYHHFNLKDYDISLDCFLKSLDCNPLQKGVYFTAGCTALAVPDYSTAIKCFREAVMQDDDNGSTWSNFGTAFLKDGQVEKAFNCYKEATRCSYNQWRVWENYLSVSARVKNMNEVLRAYTQLINLGEKYCDGDILRWIVFAVKTDMTDTKGRSCRAFYQKVIEFFKFLSTKVTSDYDVWKCYAEMYLEVEGERDMKLGIQYLIKAYHSSSLYIEKSEGEFMKCVECSIAIYSYVMAEEYKTAPLYAQHLQSLKTILQILVTKGNKMLPTLDESELKNECSECVANANVSLEAVEEAMLYT